MAENHDALASFMGITGVDSTTATQYLELTNWSLDEAVNLFMESGGQGFGGAGGSGSAGSAMPPPAPAYSEDDIRAPDPSRRQRLFNDAFENVPIRRLHEQYRDFAAESIAAINAASNAPRITPAFGGAQEETDAADRARDLGSLFQPPVNIMFKGTYAEARALAKNEGKYLLVNIQDEIVFASHMLNRDTWSDDVVQNIVASGYVFWQNYWVSEHGKKFCNLYQIDRDSLPIIAIVDPKTGKVRQQWTGFLEASAMIEKLSDFAFSNTLDADDAMTDAPAPSMGRDINDATEDEQLAAAIAASMEGAGDGGDSPDYESYDDDETKEEEVAEEAEDEEMVELPEEPADGTPDVTRVQIRAPDGARLTRRLLKSDSIALLWAFIKHQIPEARQRAFELRTSFPPAAIAFSDTETIADRKLENASLMVKWL
ncbi:hypothetical protein Poli38472_012181 [Pythium oligandrum]|uniref:UBX domain-containing protein n=1 Tax=Pythium oligandrum TaxID=41045 RepID=A0A8K1FKF8_PYTOL|nr:hypothetical protein Poli38472_012181 [Pythium oligandrum]|eukprot:TMW67065.1 hypothetical protein Poli38472_012181 [Pythium oligandrum]